VDRMWIILAQAGHRRIPVYATRAYRRLTYLVLVTIIWLFVGVWYDHFTSAVSANCHTTKSM